MVLTVTVTVDATAVRSMPMLYTTTHLHDSVKKHIKSAGCHTQWASQSPHFMSPDSILWRYAEDRVFILSSADLTDKLSNKLHSC